jgi:hypothetical protein
MNWGKNLTLLGAMRLTGWVLLSTMFASTNKERFVLWLGVASVKMVYERASSCG